MHFKKQISTELCSPGANTLPCWRSWLRKMLYPRQSSTHLEPKCSALLPLGFAGTSDCHRNQSFLVKERCFRTEVDNRGFRNDSDWKVERFLVTIYYVWPLGLESFSLMKILCLLQALNLLKTESPPLHCQVRLQISKFRSIQWVEHQGSGLLKGNGPLSESVKIFKNLWIWKIFRWALRFFLLQNSKQLSATEEISAKTHLLICLCKLRIDRTLPGRKLKTGMSEDQRGACGAPRLCLRERRLS